MIIGGKKRNVGLDLARTMAILLVLFAHTLWISDHYPKVIEVAMRLSGTIGVEVFFIISGFLIGKIILREVNRPEFSFSNVKTFILRRWFRTFPNYYLLLIINVVIWVMIYGELPEKLYKYFIYLQNFSEPSLPFYRVSWSLSVEQFSYILGPGLIYLGILLFPAKKRDHLFLLVSILIVLFFTATKVHFYFTHTLADIEDWNENIRKVLIYRLDIIYYGFLLRYLYEKKRDWLLKYRYSIRNLGILIILFLHVLRVFVGITVEDTPFFMIVLYLPLNSFAIACLMPYLDNMEIKSKWTVKVITTISLISYSLYLLHYTIILHSMKVIYPSDALRGIELWLYTFLYWGITMLLSFLLYKYFEKPITDLRDSEKLHWLFGKKKN